MLKYNDIGTCYYYENNNKIIYRYMLLYNKTLIHLFDRHKNGNCLSNLFTNIFYSDTVSTTTPRPPLLSYLSLTQWRRLDLEPCPHLTEHVSHDIHEAHCLFSVNLLSNVCDLFENKYGSMV